MTKAVTWRARLLALAVALAINSIILAPLLKNYGQMPWANQVKLQADAVITFTSWQDIDLAPTLNNKSPPDKRRAPSYDMAIHRVQAPSAYEPLPKAISRVAPASQPAIASSATSDLSAAVRKALQGLAACSASRRQLGPSEQGAACRREYANAPGGLTSASFIDPLKRSDFDAVAQAQEAKRAMMQGPIPDGYGACTGYRINAMFGCPPAPRPKSPPANLWEASAPSTDARGDP